MDRFYVNPAQHVKTASRDLHDLGRLFFFAPLSLRLSPPYASAAARATASPVDRFLLRRTFPLPEKTVYLPSFESDRNGQRVNDRFAYGSMASMAVSKRAGVF